MLFLFTRIYDSDENSTDINSPSSTEIERRELSVEDGCGSRVGKSHLAAGVDRLENIWFRHTGTWKGSSRTIIDCILV